MLGQPIDYGFQDNAASIAAAGRAATWTVRVALGQVTGNDCSAIHPASIETLPDHASFAHTTSMHASSETRPDAVGTLTDDGLALR